MKTVSILIPVLNESSSLSTLLNELREVSEREKLEFEIVVVDDGSTDDTWAEIGRLCGNLPNVRGIRLRRNFGKSAALGAGFASCSAPIIITMDGDLQDDPGEIPKLLERLEQSSDLVVGWKQRRQDSWMKRFLSRVFNSLVGVSSGVWLHDQNSGLKAIRRGVLENVDWVSGIHRFLPVLASRQGFQVAEVPVHHRPRRFGRSKYGWKRIPESILDLAGVLWLNKGIAKGDNPGVRYEIADFVSSVSK